MCVTNCVTLTLCLCWAGGVDDSWGKWSECVCNHGLELPEESGVKYRVPKCRSVCPDVSSCPDTVEFGSCDCKAVGKCQVFVKSARNTSYRCWCCVTVPT